MHAKTWALAAALAFASTAVADHGRSRVYFPHHVKRQVENSTETPEGILSSEPSVISGTPLRSTDDKSAPESEPRTSDDETPSDTALPATDDNNDSNNNAPTTGEPASERRSDSSVSETPSRGLPDIDDILTLSLPNTVDVSSTTSSTAAGTPGIIVSPTPNESEEDAESETEDEATPTTSDGIVLAPTGLLGGSTGLPDLGFGDKTTSDSVGSESPGKPNPTAPAESETTNEYNSSTPDSDTSPTADEQTVPSASEGESSGTGGLLDPIVDPIASLLPDASDDEPAGTGAKPSSTGGLLDPIVDPIESLIPDPTEGNAAPTGAKPSGSGSLPDAVESPIPSPTKAAPSGTGILDPIVDPVQSLVSSAVDDLTIPPALNLTGPTGTGAVGSEPAVTLLPTVPEAIPSLTGVPIPDLGTNGSDPNTNPADSGYTNPVGPDPTAPPLTDLPVNPTNMTIPIPEPTPTPTAGPTGPIVLPPDTNSTAPTTILPGDAYTSTSSEEPKVTLPPAQNTTIPAPKPTQAPPIHVTSVKPIATVTGKEGWLGTQLIADDATATTNTDLPAPTQSETLPQGMPNSIDASSDVVEQPDGTTLIRIVFDRRLHYEFVADNFTASQQIFMYFPTVIGHGENIKDEEVKMMRLSPIETKQKKGWITTAAFAYVPNGIIDSLQMDIHLTNSDLYNPPHPIASGIAAAIDPSYGIFPGSDLEVNSGDSEGGAGGAPFSGGDDDEEQTASQKGTTAGIAVGAVGAAVAYGAAMFLVARRYKRRKQSHRRSSSMSGTNSNSPTSDMRFAETGSPATAMMGGALLSRDFSGYGGVAGGSMGGSAGTAGGRHSQGSGQSGAGNSGRTAYISAPVAAENSLGWN